MVGEVGTGRFDGHRAGRRYSVGLSTASVYPENTEAAFRYAADLGYDGVELMVWAESVSQDIGAVAGLVRRYAIPVQAVHAPCLLISQRVWGADPVAKLERSVRTAESLGATTVVVHPPFRWQRRYAEGFADQVGELEQRSDVIVAVENMFPMRADSFFGGKERSAQRLERRGRPGRAVSAFSPSYDPTDSAITPLHPRPLAHRDGGHGRARAGAPYGSGPGPPAPGRRSRRVARRAPDPRARHPALRAVVGEHLVDTGFDGQAVLEINTQNARTRPSGRRCSRSARIRTRAPVGGAQP